MANTLLTVIIFESIVIVGAIIFMVIKNLNEILCFFHPEDFVEIEILSGSNHAVAKLKKRDKSEKSNLGFTEDHDFYFYNPNLAYTKGRCPFYLYNKGQPGPLNFRNIKSEIPSKLLKQYSQVDVSEWFKVKNSDWIIFAICGLLLGGIIGYGISQYQAGQQIKAMQTAGQIISCMIPWGLKCSKD